MRGRVILAVVLIAGAVAGGSYYWRVASRPSAPTLATADVTRGNVVEVVQATGTLQALTTVQVGTQVSGTIKSLRADYNSRVRRGQIIAELDPALFDTQVAQARASLARLEADAQHAAVQYEDAQRKLRRAQDLFTQQLISTVDLEAAQMATREAEVAQVSAQAQITQARASLRQAEVNLEHTIITAPIDGVVISRNVDVGQTVAASMQAPTLFVLARDLTRMQVNASVAESDIGRIRTGQPVSFRVDAYPDQAFPGVVTQVRLEPVIQQSVVSYVTTIEVANPDLLLKPGMTATVTVETGRADDAVRIPNAALRVRMPAEIVAQFEAPAPAGQTAERPARSEPSERSERATTGIKTTGEPGRRGEVWVMEDGQLRRVPVRVGVSDGRFTALIDGDLPEGATVVTNVATVTGTSTTTQSPLLPQRGRGAGGAGRGNTAPGR